MSQVMGNVEIAEVSDVKNMIAESTVSFATKEYASSEIKKAVNELSTTINSESERAVEAEAVLRSAIDNNKADLKSAIDKETEDRKTDTKNIRELLSKEIDDRENADIAIMSAVKATTKADFENTLHCAKLSNLPIAMITIENLDHQVKVGDVLGAVSAEYRPLIPVTASFISEAESGFVHIAVILDATGKVVVTDASPLTTNYTGNVGSATVMYITGE